MMSKNKRYIFIDILLAVLLICAVVFFITGINRYKRVQATLNQNLPDYGFAGNGTYNSPFLISNGEDLKSLSELVNAGTSFEKQYFKLTDDIDMRGISMYPIGVYGGDSYFYGTLDGDGHTINNIIINTGGNDGLFGMLGGTVRNLGIESGFIGNGDYQGACGGIASHALNSTARIINCYNKATVGGYRAGGIADNFVGIIINSWSDCELIGVEIGGTTSFVSSAGSQTFCYSTSGLNGDGTGTWYNCNQLTEEELYSDKMAKRLSANCLIWFETMTPVGQLNKWSYSDGELSINEDKCSYWNIIDDIRLVRYAGEYYTKILLITIILLIGMIFSILYRLKHTWKNSINN